jgi:hypothetical protein
MQSVGTQSRDDVSGGVAGDWSRCRRARPALAHSGSRSAAKYSSHAVIAADRGPTISSARARLKSASGYPGSRASALPSASIAAVTCASCPSGSDSACTSRSAARSFRYRAFSGRSATAASSSVAAVSRSPATRAPSPKAARVSATGLAWRRFSSSATAQSRLEWPVGANCIDKICDACPLRPRPHHRQHDRRSHRQSAGGV